MPLPLTPPVHTIIAIGQMVGDSLTLARADGGALQTFPAAIVNPSAVARNSAHGPALATAIVQSPGLTNVPWSSIESTGASGATVPITPVTSSRIRIQAVVQVASSGELNEDIINAVLFIDGAAVASSSSVLAVPAGNGVATLEIPMLWDATVTVGATHQVAIKVQTVVQSSTNFILPAEGAAPTLSTFIDIQELVGTPG